MVFVKWVKHQYYMECETHKISVSHDRAQGTKHYTLWEKTAHGFSKIEWRLIKVAPLNELKKTVQDYHEKLKRSDSKKGNYKHGRK